MSMVAGVGCQMAEGERPTLETRADSVAARLVEASGGFDAWERLPYLRFDFAVFRDSARHLVARHLWDRRSGDYRLEIPAGPDTTHVVLFNVETQEGAAYVNGEPLDEASTEQMIEDAYRRFINDSYWLLAPTKVFDPGVRRTYVADSSTAETDVLHLRFGEVGLTPDDRYWLYVDRETGRLQRWAFVLQGNPQAPPNFFEWTGYEAYEAPSGTVHLASRKESTAGPGIIYTDNIATPSSVEEGIFSDPAPRLEE